MHANFENLIVRIRENLVSGRYRNEQTVREAIVVPVLQHLGWDTFDPQAVIREYSLSSRRVDYALAISDEKPLVIIEVKGVGQIEGADQQLFEYAFLAGVPLAILTDGQQWHFFLPSEPGDFQERRAYMLDLAERSPKEATKVLIRYLNRSRIQSGEAIDDARNDCRDAASKRGATRMLPKAWNEIVSERDDRLLDLIAERAERLCGTRPEVEQVEEFVASFLSGNLGAGSKRPVGPSGTTPISPKPPGPRPPVSNGVLYELHGRQSSAKSAKEALLKILKELSSSDPRFFEKLAPRVETRKRKHIATSQSEVYPERPDLASSAVELVPGWWIGLNIANREKVRILKRACEVAKIDFGNDLKIDLPNG